MICARRRLSAKVIFINKGKSPVAFAGGFFFQICGGSSEDDARAVLKFGQRVVKLEHFLLLLNRFFLFMIFADQADIA